MQLAVMIGVNLRTIYRLESGRVETTTRHLLSLAKALQVSADWLLTGKRARPRQDSDAPGAP